MAKKFKTGDICVITGNGTGQQWGDGKLNHFFDIGDSVVVDYPGNGECLVYSPKGPQFVQKEHLWNTGLSLNTPA